MVVLASFIKLNEMPKADNDEERKIIIKPTEK